MSIIEFRNTWKVEHTGSPMIRRNGLLSLIAASILFGSVVGEVSAQGKASIYESPNVLLINEGKASVGVISATRSDPGLLIVEKDRYDRKLVEAVPEALTVLKLENGTKLEFIDVGDGYVGIAEYAPANATLVTNKLVDGWDATPLEIYLLLAPQGYNVPDALVTDHNLQRARNGQREEQPRTLNIEPGVLYSFNDPGLEDYSCTSPGYEWRDDWEAAFGGVTDYYPVGYGHQLASAFYFYPGYPVYAGTGTNRLTYLGACNGDNSNILSIEIHRWAVTDVIYQNSPFPPIVVWGWAKIKDEAIGGLSKYLFYSAHPAARYRARLDAENEFSAVDHFGLAAAWTKSYPLQIGF